MNNPHPLDHSWPQYLRSRDNPLNFAHGIRPNPVRYMQGWTLDDDEVPFDEPPLS